MALRLKQVATVAMIVTGVLAAWVVCVGSAFALWGLSGYRGEVCLDLGERPEILRHTGRLTRCDVVSRQDDGTARIAVEGPLGCGEVMVTPSGITVTPSPCAAGRGPG